VGVSLSSLLRPGNLGPMLRVLFCRRVSCIPQWYPCILCRGGGRIRNAGSCARRLVITRPRVPRSSACSTIIRVSRGISVGIGISMHITTSHRWHGGTAIRLSRHVRTWAGRIRNWRGCISRRWITRRLGHWERGDKGIHIVARSSSIRGRRRRPPLLAHFMNIRSSIGHSRIARICSSCHIRFPSSRVGFQIRNHLRGEIPICANQITLSILFVTVSYPDHIHTQTHFGHNEIGSQTLCNPGLTRASFPRYRQMSA